MGWLGGIAHLIAQPARHTGFVGLSLFHINKLIEFHLVVGIDRVCLWDDNAGQSDFCTSLHVSMQEGKMFVCVSEPYINYIFAIPCLAKHFTARFLFLWIRLNWNLMSLSDPLDNLGSIWNCSEPSQVFNSTNNKLVDNFMSTEFRSGFRK